ncbi:Aste57867_8548 [Aphanomyces stellatus]|uniref:Aste57867_8548 protein n=1 Tax=Aphanomyces stellatus TaxID=120398 RepID=A0A485KKL5_9STRA|nr:hypothetical protein As57867_008516 [Aphanomyces stellatus]VFT85434.1 Aste57867_8548 [Aphanomyces stellatus]
MDHLGTKLRLDVILNPDDDVSHAARTSAVVMEGGAATLPGTADLKESTQRRRRPPPSGTTSTRQKVEIEVLKAELKTLHAQIQEMEVVSSSRKMTYWEHMAKIQGLERLKAVATNGQLTEAVREHTAWTDEINLLLKKKRRLMHPTDASMRSWEAYVLPPFSTDDAGSLSRRRRAMHAIADREYDRLQSVYLQAGVLGRNGAPFFQSALKPQPSGAVVFEFVEHTTVAAPFDRVGAAMWRAVSTNLPVPEGGGLVQTIDTIDDDVVYNCVTNTRQAIPLHSNIVLKRYRNATSVIQVARGILVDPMCPTDASVLVEDVTVWNGVTADETAPDAACVFTLVIRLNLGHVIIDETEDLTSQLATMSLAQVPKTQGTLGTDALRGYFETQQHAPVTMGNLHIYLGRVLRMEGPMRRGINDVVEAFQREQQQQRRLEH